MTLADSAPADLQRTVGRNTLLNVASKGAYLILWILLTPALLERLGREQFGFWSLLMMLGGSVTFFDLGLTAAVTRYTAHLVALDGGAEVRRMVARALGVYATLGLVVSLAGALSSGPILGLFHVGESWRTAALVAYGLTLASFALATLAGVLQAALTGMQRMDITSGIGIAGAPLLAWLVLRALGWPEPLPALILAQLLQTSVIAIALLLGFSRLAAKLPAVRVRSRSGAPTVRDMMRFGAKVQTSVLSTFLHLQADKVLIGAMVGLTFVTPVELGLRIANGLSNLPTLFLGALLPALADRDARRSGQDRSALYRTVMVPYVLTLVPLGVAFMTVADPLIRLWMGAPRPDAVLALRLLLSTSTVVLMAGIAVTLARAAGRPGMEAWFGIVLLTLHVALGALGIRLWGWTGAPIGGLVASLFATTTFLVSVERWLGLRPLSGVASAVVPAGIASAVAAALVLLILRAWSPGTTRAHNLGALIGCGIAFAISYVMTLRVVAPAQWRLVSQRVRSMLSVRREPVLRP